VVFGRQGRHLGLAHVGRIAHDQVVALAIQPRIDIGLHDTHPLFQAMSLGVALRHFQGFGRDVGQVHPRLGKGMRAGDTDAARTGAEIQIRASKVPKFRPGRSLKDAVNS